MSVVRRRGAKLAAVAAGLVALGVFAAGPAPARHDGPAHGSDAGKQRSDAGKQRSDAGERRSSGDAVVNFRRNAIFTCFGADGTGTATATTATITASRTAVNAVVTVHAPPGTTVFGDLTQSGCVKLQFFSFKIGASGVGSTTVTDVRVSNDAFVFIEDTVGDFQITPEVVFS
jgi:hypothetical protein